MVWAVFGKRGTHLDHANCERIPRQRGAGFAVCSFWCPMLGDLFAYFQNEGHAGSSHRIDPEEQQSQNQFGKVVFCVIALAALWHPVGVISFCVCMPRVLQWSPKKCQQVFENNGVGDSSGIRFEASI